MLNRRTVKLVIVAAVVIVVVDVVVVFANRYMFFDTPRFSSTPIAAATPSQRFKPQFNGINIPAEDVKGIGDEEIVLGTVVNGEPRAYPIGAFDSHEHLNDRVGETDVLVAW